MKRIYTLVLPLILLILMASCGQKKQSVEVEVEVQDWGVVTQEITLGDNPVTTEETPTP